MNDTLEDLAKIYWRYLEDVDGFAIYIDGHI